ncbi:hypothetical protein ACHAXS_010050 [Conticribra weissflogii]
MDSMLQEARLLNSDLGRHCVRSKFTSHLSGRFYNNSSLERHTAKRRNLSKMKAKVRKLEREHKLQVARNQHLLLIKKEVERKHELAIDRLFKFLKGMTKLQSHARRKLEMRLYREMKEHRLKMMNEIARFCQIHYRGWKGRLRFRSIRKDIRQKLMNDTATIIQARIRGCLERKRPVQRKRQRELLYNQSAITAQTFWRGQRARMEYFALRKELRNKAALDLQRLYRGMRGRRIVAKMREELERTIIPEKPKRIPLHKRRYSTYGAKLPLSRAVQGGARKRDHGGSQSRSRICNKRSREIVVQEPSVSTSSTGITSLGVRPKGSEKISTHRLGGNRLSSKLMCKVEAEKRHDCGSINDDETRSYTSNSLRPDTNKLQKHHSSMPPLVEENVAENIKKPPLTIFEEASLIIGEIFGDRISHLSIMKSSFEHSFVERDDDLEISVF